MDDSILFIEKQGCSGRIHRLNKEVEFLDTSPMKYLNRLCLEKITTLEGRIQAIKQTCNIVQNVPIYIDDNLILFSINSFKSVDNIFINSVYIKYIEKQGIKTKIVFYDNECIVIKKPSHLMKSKYEKCMKIKKQINQYC